MGLPKVPGETRAPNEAHRGCPSDSSGLAGEHLGFGEPCGSIVRHTVMVGSSARRSGCADRRSQRRFVVDVTGVAWPAMNAGLRRAAISSFLAVIALIAVGCGENGVTVTRGGTTVVGRGLTPEALGACPSTQPDVGPDSLIIGAGRLMWVKADELTEVTGRASATNGTLGEGLSVFAIGSPTVLQSSPNLSKPPKQVLLPPSDGRALIGLLASGRHLLLSIQPGSTLPQAFGAVEEPDGSLAFVGTCAYLAETEPVEAFAQAERAKGAALSTSQIFERILSDPHGQFAQDFLRPPARPTPWTDLPPDQRSLDPQETPTSILNQLEPFHFELIVPAGWQTMSERLCTLSAEGWNQCYRLAGMPRGQVALMLIGYCSPGERVQLLVLNGQRYTSPRTVAAHLSCQELTASTPVSLRGNPAIHTEADLLRPSAHQPIVLPPTPSGG